jgi:CubicO group peptidase (beta-lactamase class C family)
VALVWRDGAPVFTHAAGVAHRGLGVPVRPDTRFLVSSVTKLVTAVTALRLVDRGLLDLHGSAAAVLPPAQRPASLVPEVSLHHLLSHTSGVANYHVDEDETWASFTSCWDRIPTYHLRGSGAMLPLFADRPARFAPGEHFSYADANFLLVGLMIEAVTGSRFPEVARAEVFENVGMADSGFPFLDEEPPRLATGYLVTDDPPETWRSNVYSVPAGGMPTEGLVTTATDLARLVDALQSGALLPPACRPR